MKRFCSILLVVVLLFTANFALADYVKVALRSDLNVRKEASYKGEVIGHLFRNDEVTVKERLKTGWTKIAYDGGTAYVRSSFLSKTKLSGGQGKDAFPTLKHGSKVAAVQTLQRNLNTIMDTELEITGVFDDDTKAAVMKFQKKYGLTQDGIVGKKTWKKIIELR